MTWRITAIVLILFTVGCATSKGAIQDGVVVGLNSTALTIEASQTTAELLYKAHQALLVEKAKREQPLPTQSVVMGRLEAVRTRWDPVWDMFAKLREAHGRAISFIDANAGLDKILSAANELSRLQATVADKLKDLREAYQTEDK